MVSEVEIIGQLHRDQKQIFESLEEGILLIQENEITFNNQLFEKIQNRYSSLEGDILDQKILKIYRSGEEQSSSRQIE